MYFGSFCFFFFKQKTAYVMRISDWSSDVCSSDLFSGFGATANNSQFTSNRSITTDYSAGFKWHAGDHLKINGDFQYVDATAENRSFTAFPQRDGGTLSIDLSGKLPQIQFGPAGVDRKSTRLNSSH